MADQIDEIKARLAAATPGPWEWGGHVRGAITLQGATPPHVYILDPPRSGSGYACWRVQPKEVDRNERGWGGMVPMREYAVLERPYREDIERVDHPDAELIAHAPADIEFLLGEVERWRTEAALAGGAGDVHAERAALMERERDGAQADLAAAREENQRLRESLAETDTQLWSWTKGNGVDPEWRPLSVREQHRTNWELLRATLVREDGDGLSEQREIDRQRLIDERRRRPDADRAREDGGNG